MQEVVGSIPIGSIRHDPPDSIVAGRAVFNLPSPEYGETRCGRPLRGRGLVLSDAAEVSATHQRQRPEPIGPPAGGNAKMSESGFERREEGFEAKFHAEGDQKFRLEMRRDKLFAQWVSGQLELSGEDAEAYAASKCRSDVWQVADGSPRYAEFDRVVWTPVNNGAVGP